MKPHLSSLRDEGLVTGRASVMMEAEGGSSLEVFERVSREALERAHEKQEVSKLGTEYAKVSDYVPVADLNEARPLFSAFTPFDP